jgi:hypothetical protein
MRDAEGLFFFFFSFFFNFFILILSLHYLESRNKLFITTRMIITIFIANKAWVRCGYPRQNEKEWYKR